MSGIRRLGRHNPARSGASDVNADFCVLLAKEAEKRAQARLGAILRADPLAVRVTNRRLRAGIPQDRIKR